MIADLAVVGAVLAATALVALWWRARDGRARGDAGERFTSDELTALDAPRDARVLLLLTAPGCRRCGPARRVLESVADDHDEVVVHAFDLSHPYGADLAQARSVLRTPTVFVLDPGGVVRARLSGVPQPTDLHELLADDRAA